MFLGILTVKTLQRSWKGCLPLVGQPHPGSEIKEGSEDQTFWGLKIVSCMERHLTGAGRLLLVLGDTRAALQVRKFGTEGKGELLLHLGEKASVCSSWPDLPAALSHCPFVANGS